MVWLDSFTYYRQTPRKARELVENSRAEVDNECRRHFSRVSINFLASEIREYDLSLTLARANYGGFLQLRNDKAAPVHMPALKSAACISCELGWFRSFGPLCKIAGNGTHLPIVESPLAERNGAP